MEYFPMFRAVREANQRNEGEARAHSAAAYERAILLWLRSYMFIHACTFFLAQSLASEWLRNSFNNYILTHYNTITLLYFPPKYRLRV